MGGTSRRVEKPPGGHRESYGKPFEARPYRKETEKADYATAVTTVFGLNPIGADLFKLKRVLPANDLTDVELEAYVCGLTRVIGESIRSLRRMPGVSGRPPE